MGSYYYLPHSKSETGFTTIPEEEYVEAILNIATKKGVKITDKEIFREIYDKNTKEKTSMKIKAGTNLYVDGTNLFVGLVELFGISRLPQFSSILKQINKIIKVDQIFFYASYTLSSNKKYKNSIAVEAKFYQQVRKTPNLVFYKGHRSPTSGKEKGVDVHLAVDIIKHCFQNQCGHVVIMSGDADLSYPLEVAKEIGQKTSAVFLPNRFSLGISHRASNSFILNYKNRFKPIRRDLPNSLKVIKIKDPARKRTG